MALPTIDGGTGEIFQSAVSKRGSFEEEDEMLLAQNERDLFDDDVAEQEVVAPTMADEAVVVAASSVVPPDGARRAGGSRMSSAATESFVTAAADIDPSDLDDENDDEVDDDSDAATHDVPIDDDGGDDRSLGASVASSKHECAAAGSGGGVLVGVHMVDHVDPDAVDFTPLHVSESGAALTPCGSVAGGGALSSDDDEDDMDDSLLSAGHDSSSCSAGGSSAWVSVLVSPESVGPLTAAEAEGGSVAGVRAAGRARRTSAALVRFMRLLEAVGESMGGALSWASHSTTEDNKSDKEGGTTRNGFYNPFATGAANDDADDDRSVSSRSTSSSSFFSPPRSLSSVSSRSVFSAIRDAEVRFRALVLLPLLVKIGTISGLVKDGRRKSSHAAKRGLSKLAGDGPDGDPSVASSLGVCAAFFFVIVLTSFATSGLGEGEGGRMALKSSEPAGRTAGGNGMRLSALGASVGVVDLSPPRNTQLPRELDKIANVDDLPLELMDTAVFWHVPRSGGTTMKHVMATCLGRVITSEVGGQEGHAMDERLEIVQKPYGNFVNVDTTTPLGLKRASELGLAPSRIADVVFTPFVREATVLFDKDHRGRFFTMLRDPVSRIQSLYYFRRMNNALGDMTLETFVREQGENWMVRTLTGSMSGQLDVAKLNEAKEVLRTKFLIGIFAEKTETLRRIESYFGWKFPSPVAQNCKNQLYYFEWHSRNEHPVLAEDDEVSLLIQRQNRYDMELYEYALQLFREQEKFFWGGDVTETRGVDVAQDGVRGAANKARRRI